MTFVALLLSLAIQSDSAAPAAVVTWAASHTASLDDLRPVEAVIGRARVVGLGEAGHGLEEVYRFRNRLVESLIERGAITALAAETGYSESVAVDDYINGLGDLTPQVVGSVFSWSIDAPYAANRALLEWLRAYNLRASTTLRAPSGDVAGGHIARPVRSCLSPDGRRPAARREFPERRRRE